MTGIFVSYRQNHRRPDGQTELCGHAQLVETTAELLARHFGPDGVFLDTSLRVASRYPDEIRKRLRRCDVVLAVIHPEWLRDLNDRRAHLQPGDRDWVHLELKTALKSGTPIVPLLLNDAAMPTRWELPADIAEFALAQAHRLRFGQLPADLHRLFDALELHVPPTPVIDSEAPTQGTTNRRRLPLEPWTVGLVALAAPFPLAVALLDDPMARATWLAAIAFVILAYQTSILVMTLVMYLLRKPFDAVSRDAAEVAPSDRNNVIIGITIAAAGAIILTTEDALSRTMRTTLLGVASLIILFFGPKWLARRETASKWPQATITASPSGIRAALAQLQRHLDRCRPPLSRLEHDKAEFALTQLADAVTALTQKYQSGRRTWLRHTDRWLLLLSVATTATAIGTILCALWSYWQAGGELRLATLAAGGGIIAACALHAITVELAYRLQRWRSQRAVDTAHDKCAQLTKRLLEASIRAPRS